MISFAEMTCLLLAIVGIMVVGCTHLRLNIWLFSMQTTLIALVTACYGIARDETELFFVATAVLIIKAIGVPRFLTFIAKKVEVERDRGTFVPTPIAMHLSLGFLAVSYMLAMQLPMPHGTSTGWSTATAAISLVGTGIIIMLTRRIALSQIIGFLVLENGIYLFGLTHTRGMPLLVEMGILLDLLVGVMLAGLLAFRIKKNFEHIDVTLLSDLREE
jgi:hydrogenase-4 component E